MRIKRNLIQICLPGAMACLNPLRRAAELVSKQWNVINPPAALLDQSQQQGVVDAESMMLPGWAMLIQPVSRGYFNRTATL
jgi:hypothetical protein